MPSSVHATRVSKTDTNAALVGLKIKETRQAIPMNCDVIIMGEAP